MALLEIVNPTKEPTRYYSSKQEKSIAKKLNGKQQVNSGATKFKKGDVELDSWLLECKTKMTKSDSISIKKDWLEKTEKEALFMGKPYSALVINFGPDTKNYVVIDENVFKELLDSLKEN